MNSEELKKFSAELKEKREELSISLKQISQKTRIDLKFLEAIESADFKIIDEVYIRAFIREYAKSIGLDPENTIRDYDFAKSGRPAMKEVKINSGEETLQQGQTVQKVYYSAPETTTDLNEASVSEVKNKYRLIIGGLLIILLAAAAIIFFGRNDTIIIKETPYEEVLKERETLENIDRYELIEEKIASADDTLLASGKLILKIIAKDTTWLRIVSDGGTPDEFIIAPNLSRNVIADKEFNIIIGNAGGIDLMLNNIPLQFSGKTGEIKNIRVDSTGLKYLRIDDLR